VIFEKLIINLKFLLKPSKKTALKEETRKEQSKLFRSEKTCLNPCRYRTVRKALESLFLLIKGFTVMDRSRERESLLDNRGWHLHARRHQLSF